MRPVTRLVLACTFTIAACRGGEPGPATSQAVSQKSDDAGHGHGTVSPSFDVGGVVRQVPFASRPEAEGFAGGHSTYGVRVGAAGAWSFQGHHFIPATASTPGGR